jgi:hypothetical protein
MATEAGQSRKQAVIEAILNVLVGYGVAVAAQAIIFPWFGIQLSTGHNLLMGVVFTVVSLVRSYALRRAFNWYHIRHG